jgi:hypothetical protein
MKTVGGNDGKGMLKFFQHFSESISCAPAAIEKSFCCPDSPRKQLHRRLVRVIKFSGRAASAVSPPSVRPGQGDFLCYTKTRWDCNHGG